MCSSKVNMCLISDPSDFVMKLVELVCHYRKLVDAQTFALANKNNFLCLFRWVRIETHFPLKSPFLYFVQIFTKLFSSCIWIIYYRKQGSVVCKKTWVCLKIFSQTVYIDQKHWNKEKPVCSFSNIDDTLSYTLALHQLFSIPLENSLV